MMHISDSPAFQKMAEQTARLLTRVVNADKGKARCESCRDTGFIERRIDTPIGQLVFAYVCEATVKTPGASVAYCEAASTIESGYYPPPKEDKKKDGNREPFSEKSYEGSKAKISMPAPDETEAEMLKLSATLPTQGAVEAWMERAKAIVEDEFSKSTPDHTIFVTSEHAEVVLEALDKAVNDPKQDANTVLDDLIKQLESLED